MSLPCLLVPAPVLHSLNGSSAAPNGMRLTLPRPTPAACLPRACNPLGGRPGGGPQ